MTHRGNRPPSMEHGSLSRAQFAQWNARQHCYGKGCIVALGDLANRRSQTEAEQAVGRSALRMLRSVGRVPMAPERKFVWRSQSSNYVRIRTLSFCLSFCWTYTFATQSPSSLSLVQGWRIFMGHVFACVHLLVHMHHMYLLYVSTQMCPIFAKYIPMCLCLHVRVCVSDLCEWKIPPWSSLLSPQCSLSFFHSSLSFPCSSPHLFDTRLCVKQGKNWKYYMPQIVRRVFPLSPWQCVYNAFALRVYLFLKPPLSSKPAFCVMS